MPNRILEHFVRSLHDEVVSAMKDADSSGAHPQYRLGVRRLAKSYFDSFELYEIGGTLPGLPRVDVDAWYAGEQLRG
jgi:hypothetical protein